MGASAPSGLTELSAPIRFCPALPVKNVFRFYPLRGQPRRAGPLFKQAAPQIDTQTNRRPGLEQRLSCNGCCAIFVAEAYKKSQPKSLAIVKSSSGPTVVSLKRYLSVPPVKSVYYICIYNNKSRTLPFFRLPDGVRSKTIAYCVLYGVYAFRISDVSIVCGD
jgi:hypothetical protein